jgi:ferritin
MILSRRAVAIPVKPCKDQYTELQNTMPTSNIPSKVGAQLQRQLNQELGAAHAYQAMSIWCATQNFKGFAGFFAQQAGEEREHARKVIDHLIDRGLAPDLAELPRPKQDFATLLQVAQWAQTMERANTHGINSVYEAAVADKDYPAQVLMHWFIAEQVEEEAWAAELVDRVGSATCAGSLADLDRHSEKIFGDRKAD